MKKIVVAASLLVFVACNNGSNENTTTEETNTAPAVLNYFVANVHPHDTSSYTQGFEWRDGVLYEGTGLKGDSVLRKDDLETGKALQEVKITDPNIFGEGITILGGKIYQLSWQEHKVFVYDLA